MIRTLRHIWHVLQGNSVILLDDSENGVIIMAIPTKTQASLNSLQSALAKLAASSAAGVAAAAQADQDDTDTAAAIDALTAQVQAALPPEPAPVEASPADAPVDPAA